MLATADPQRPWATLPRAELLTGLAAEAAAQQAGAASNTPMSGPGQGQLAYRESQALVSSNQQQRQQPVNSLPNGYAGVARACSLRVTSDLVHLSPLHALSKDICRGSEESTKAS